MAVDLIRGFIEAAVTAPDRPAVVEVDTGRTFDRGRILAAAIATARLLDDTIPPGSSETVMLHGPGGAAYWAGILAILGSGRRVLPVGSESTNEDRERLAEAHRIATVLETDPDRRWEGPPATVRQATVDLETPSTTTGLTSLARGGSASLLLRSSGTTGRPAVALREARALDRVTATLVEHLGLGPEDRVLATLPMQHAYGIEHGVLAPMRAGATVVFKSGFDLMGGADALLDGTTVFPAVPVTLEAATRIGRLGTTLRLAYTAGSPLPENVRREFEEAWGVPVGDLYGMTEIGTISWGFESANPPVGGVSIAVRDESSGVVSRCGSGEVLVLSDAMFAGYLDRHDARPEPGHRTEGLFRTGDLGEIDARGRLRLTGRAKLQFDVGGLKVNPAEVESVLAEVDGVAEVVVVPLDLSPTVCRVRAVVVATDRGLEASIEEALRETARVRLAPHQRPRVVDFVPELPRTLTGKLLRGRLLEGI